MIKKILLGLLVIIAAVLVVAAFQPSEFRVQRSIVINATPPAVFPEINDLHRMQVWSPWKKLDPDAKYTFSGPQSGVGATQSWVGNSQMGEGRMEIIESSSDVSVRLKLEFIKPFASQSTAEYSLKPGGSGTEVTWAMLGPKNYMSKVMCMFMSMDKMVGSQFEEGLASLKQIVEAQK